MNSRSFNQQSPFGYFPHSPLATPPMFLSMSPQGSRPFPCGQTRAEDLMNNLLQSYRFRSLDELVRVVPELLPLVLFSMKQQQQQQQQQLQQQQALAMLQQRAYHPPALALSNSISIDTSTPLASCEQLEQPKMLSSTKSSSLSETSSPTGSAQTTHTYPSTRKVRPDGLKSACNFCTKQRSRCIMSEDGKNCQRCQKRGSPCIFSLAKKRGRPRTRDININAKKQRVESSEDEKDEEGVTTEEEEVSVNPDGVEVTSISL